MTHVKLNIPISEEEIRSLHIEDTVTLSGILVIGRDTAHKHLVETFIHTDAVPESERPLYEALQRFLRDGVIFHCGPVVRRQEDGQWEFVAAGPTTSIRAEVYEPDIITHFGLRGVVGKGGMGPKTLQACREYGAVYLHAVGGAGSLIADTVKEVIAVHKQEEFGTPEAIWIIRVEDFPAVVTMDSHGRSVHDEVEAASGAALQRLLGHNQ
jgi:fumarate hydratase subunit beta